jgi:hemerythrin
MFETNAFDLRHLDEEHAEILRRYTGLEKAILCGRGWPRILEAADSLVQKMLLHLAHEKQFLVKLSLSSRLQAKHRKANTEVTTQLFGIDAGLEREETSAVFLLLRLGRVWMKEHMHLESIECKGLTEEKSPYLVRRAVVDHRAKFGNRGGQDHHLKGQPA